MKKILIALDYDPTAKKIATQGYAMSKAMGAEVTLLHVLVNPAMYSSTNSTMGMWEINPLNTIDSLEMANQGSLYYLEKVKRYLNDKTIQILIKEGDFAQMILEASSEINADCIVMGSHSQKWLENILLGSVTEEVLRKTTIPMFIIPTKKMDD